MRNQQAVFLGAKPEDFRILYSCVKI